MDVDQWGSNEGWLNVKFLPLGTVYYVYGITAASS
jgi:hypothetical protein